MDLFSKESFTQHDIEQLIRDRTEESLHIEFKNAGSLNNTEPNKKEIAKDVSAFANSDGGIIFYGINEENHVASGLSFVNGNVTTKEWLENVILDNISQRLEKLLIVPVRFDNIIEQTIYVVKVPRSDISPHMNLKDKLYYRRYNFKILAMEEYEIRNLYLTRRDGKVVIDSLGINSMNKLDFRDSHYRFELSIYIANRGNFLCEKYKAVCFMYQVDGVGYRVDKEYNVTDVPEEGVKISNREIVPVFPNEVIRIMSFIIDIPVLRFDEINEKLKFDFYTFYSDKLVETEFPTKFLFKKSVYDIEEKWTENGV